MDLLTKTSNLTLNLYGNPLQCSCDTLDFLKWLKATKVEIFQLNKYACFYREGIVKLDCLDKILAERNLQCSATLIIGVFAGAITFLAVVFAISVCFYGNK